MKHRFAAARRFWIVLVVVFNTIAAARSGDNCLKRICPPAGPYRVSALMLCCPDDYCRKPFPCVTCPSGWCPDDYCRKSFPCLCRPVGWCPDDYCGKPMPSLCWPPLPATYRCWSAPANHPESLRVVARMATELTVEGILKLVRV